jgi:hypothetical protein
LAVEVIDDRKIEPELRVARHGRGGIAGEHVDFARLQGGEAVLGGQWREPHLVRIIEDGGRDGAAELHVEARPVALRVRHAEAGEGRIGAAGKKSFLLDVVQGGLGRSFGRNEARGEAHRDGKCPFHVRLSPTLGLLCTLRAKGRPRRIASITCDISCRVKLDARPTLAP